jgi:hypothetical protein
MAAWFKARHVRHKLDSVVRAWRNKGLRSGLSDHDRRGVTEPRGMRCWRIPSISSSGSKRIGASVCRSISDMLASGRQIGQTQKEMKHAATERIVVTFFWGFANSASRLTPSYPALGLVMGDTHAAWRVKCSIYQAAISLLG